MRFRITRLARLAVLALGLSTAGCVCVPDGNIGLITTPCGQKISSVLTPGDACFTVVASSGNDCNLTVTLTCDKGGDQVETLRPGQRTQKGGLCCPDGTTPKLITVECGGEQARDTCRYVISGHQPGAPNKCRIPCLWWR